MFTLERMDTPPDLPDGTFSCSIRTAQSHTLVVTVAHVPMGCESDPGWRALRLVGPLPLTLTGVLAEVLAPLAAAEISVFPVAAWETDFVLVRTAQVDAATAALRAAGFACGPPTRD